MPFATTWLQLQIIVQNELREIPFDITYMWNLKCGTFFKNIETYRHRDQICGCKGEGKEWTGNLELVLMDADYDMQNG